MASLTLKKSTKLTLGSNMPKDRAHDGRRVAGNLSGKGKASDIIKGTTDLKTFLTVSPYSAVLKSAHIQKPKPMQTIDEYEEKHT